MDRFPLPDNADYRYEQRFGMDHLGTDIMAPAGTVVVAVEPGVAWSSVEPKGGNVVYLQAGGTRYFYGHLQRFAPELATRDAKVNVSTGDSLGFVGNTGNAEGRPPHVHFQERRGSLVIDPFDDLAAVDLQHRGSRPSSVGPSAVLLLAILWFASQRS